MADSAGTDSSTTTGKPDTEAGSFSFVDTEHQVLRFWAEAEVFQKSLAQTRNGKPYIFYDGPPFATGLPHHGHLVGSTLKDVMPRYYTMKGHYVQRRFGWDCHGLPIEHEIDKSLGMSAQEAVTKLGLKGYNDACRSIVQRYTREWEKTITRIGRWVDFRNDYKTMEPWYMESVWWVMKQLWDKELVYQSVKVVPYSTALGTVLSNFEAGTNYQNVQDPSVTVLFKLQDEDAHIAAWTTTPWTLPSNLGLCVNADIDYVRVHDSERDLRFYLARARLGEVGKSRNLVVEAELRGSELVGRRYEPLFPYFAAMEDEGAFQVLADAYVTTDSGTGVVHMAPAFGEDDFRVMNTNGIAALVCPLDQNGRFTDEVGDFAGQYVKDADKGIIRRLRDSGSLYSHEVIEHSYPFCPRSDTPIIYRTIPSWYVKVEQIKHRIGELNQQINWVPEHIRDGRMGNWLDNAIDWSVSRNRYWGTPLPIWINDETDHRICIGSIDELEHYTGVRVADLHREHVDNLTFQLEGEPGTYRRVEEVLDCWFESGSMPYAQLHYPFENQDLFKAGFPAEYIAEGLDQTRGWFYTLLVLGTALFDQPAFRNVIVNGIVMAEDGKKMSKRLQNYTPPDLLMEQYGADALRLYLINSGLVKGEEQRFTDTGVRDMVRRILLPWYNAFRFLQTYADIDGWQSSSKAAVSDNITDQWILSRLQSLKANIAREMAAYRLYNVVPELFEFIEDLTNWYIRLNRSRFWAEGMSPDKVAAFETLYRTLHELNISMAPFAPFLAEHVFQQLRACAAGAVPESVHLCSYPEAEEDLIRTRLEAAVARMQNIILLGRQKRNQVKIKTKVPLARLTIIHQDQSMLDEIARLEDYIKAELNVKQVDYTTAEADYIAFHAKPNSAVLGKRLGKAFKKFKPLIENLNAEQLHQLRDGGELLLEGERFSNDDILLFREAKAGTEALSNRFISIDMDCTLNDALIAEGRAREVVNRIQKTRKALGLNLTDRIEVTYQADAELAAAITEHRDHIARETFCSELQATDEVAGHGAEHTFDIDNLHFGMTIRKLN
ncbi:MAG: isoleucine--tRNA ligase [Natronospirillum sp.]|uniref:isoleucine--tRNA ligase n=1 Tax=Natronospirillum sp. TaxID=2812955 RepID=UPI0025FB61FE|nr:isoleucine--tRNA ligase [Natronospirillum sp.]MCH8551571.1 isoleucine--tRNA ligase [Natronospirillum sp.]